MTPFRLTAPCKDYLWGGNKLREYGKSSDKDCIAESWELSCHPDGESIIADGEYAGRTLTEFLADHPEALGENCARFDRFPVLIKLIDARDNLSVQVHPDDLYAMRVEGEYGKTEMWYIVDAEPDAELIYGFKAYITKEEFRRAIEDNTLLHRVNRVPVRPGDVFFIQAGTLHAIGKGILIAEIQQNSNTTYRVYDYGRVGADGKPRELHIDKALEVTTLKSVQNRCKPVNLQPWIKNRKRLSVQTLGECSYFSSDLMIVNGQASAPLQKDSFHHILVLEGAPTLEFENCSIPAAKGTSVFVPAGAETFKIDGKCKFIITTIR